MRTIDPTTADDSQPRPVRVLRNIPELPNPRSALPVEAIPLPYPFGLGVLRCLRCQLAQEGILYLIGQLRVIVNPIFARQLLEEQFYVLGGRSHTDHLPAMWR